MDCKTKLKEIEENYEGVVIIQTNDDMEYAFDIETTRFLHSSDETQIYILTNNTENLARELGTSEWGEMLWSNDDLANHYFLKSEITSIDFMDKDDFAKY